MQAQHNHYLKSYTSQPLLSTMFNPLHSSMNSTSAIKVATIKIQTIASLRVLPKLTISKDEWNTKDDTGKSLKNALHVLWYTIRHLSG